MRAQDLAGIIFFVTSHDFEFVLQLVSLASRTRDSSDSMFMDHDGLI